MRRRRAPAASGSAPGMSPRRPAEHENSPAEALPLPVRRQQLRRLVGLDPPSAQGGHELDQPEVADEPLVIAPEPLERDHADRPGADAALAAEAPDTTLGVVPRSRSRSSERHESGSVAARPGQRLQARAGPARGRDRPLGLQPQPDLRRIAARSPAARPDSISWPHMARNAAWATVAEPERPVARATPERSARATDRRRTAGGTRRVVLEGEHETHVCETLVIGARRRPRRACCRGGRAPSPGEAPSSSPTGRSARAGRGRRLTTSSTMACHPTRRAEAAALATCRGMKLVEAVSLRSRRQKAAAVPRELQPTRR